MAFEEENSSEPMETTFTFDQTAGGKFLSLYDLGNLLLHLASQGYYHIFFTTRFFFSSRVFLNRKEFHFDVSLTSN